MSSDGWRYASASVIGTSHLKTSGVCQDANRCEILTSPAGELILVTVVSDGAGSASRSNDGAARLCNHICSSVQCHLQKAELNSIDTAAIGVWIKQFQSQMDCLAKEEGVTRREYACTLLASIVGPTSAVFFQIGDGAIVIADSDENEYAWVFWPDRGEYENTTFFVTEESALSNLHFESTTRRIWQLAILSDGLQRLALHLQTKSVHSPFFQAFFSPLRRETAGHASTLSVALEQFLNSERVNSRTDDDKTLVIATCLPQPT